VLTLNTRLESRTGIRSCICVNNQSGFLIIKMNYYTDKDINNRLGKEYCRRSNDSDEKQVFSLEDQHAINLKLLERFKVTHFGEMYEESISAKRRGRPLFNRMVGDIESGKYSVIVCWALNRLSRNAVDGAMLIELMDNKKLFAIITAGKVYYNTSEDKLLLQIEFGLSKKYSDDIWPSVERGMNSKVHRHWWPGKPKPGYLNLQDAELGEPIQIIDIVRFPLLRRAIDEILKGVYPRIVLNTLNKEWGYRTRKTKRMGNQPLAETNFYKMLRDPFYYGKLIWNGQESSVHESLPRLMTEDEYWQIQKALGMKGVPRPKTDIKLPYRGLIDCGCCNHKIVIYPKYKNLKTGERKQYLYAKCSKKGLNEGCTQSHVKVEVIDSQIKDLLANVRISQRFYDWAMEWLKKDHEEQSATRLEDLSKNHQQIETKNKALDNLLEMRISGEIDKATYLQKKTQYEKEIAKLTTFERNIHNQAKDWRKLVEKALNVALFAYENFDSASVDSKMELMHDLGSNFRLNGDKLSVDIEKPFIIFENNQEYLNNNFDLREPNENIVVKDKSGDLKPITDIWWARRESNPYSREAGGF
jgi:site-specific DNA recombinase